MPNTDESLKETLPEDKTILIVEDDTEIREFYLLAIREETPYHAIPAPDGFQALKLVRSLRPDLFMLDYQLPRMNGIELYDQLHTTKGLEDIPTLFMSANPPRKELEKRQVYSLDKPVDLEKLLQTIEKLLAG